MGKDSTPLDWRKEPFPSHLAKVQVDSVGLGMGLECCISDPLPVGRFLLLVPGHLHP